MCRISLSLSLSLRGNRGVGAWTWGFRGPEFGSQGDRGFGAWTWRFRGPEFFLAYLGRLIFIHLQCWEVLPFCRFQRQWCLKIRVLRAQNFYTPLALKTAKGQRLPAMEVHKNQSPISVQLGITALKLPSGLCRAKGGYRSHSIANRCDPECLLQGPEISKVPKVVRRGCKRCFGPREQRSPKSLLHHQKPVLHRCNSLLHQCKRTLVPLAQKTFCTLS